MEQQALIIFLAIYVGTLVLNVIIAGVQFNVDRNRAQGAIFYFWLGNLPTVFLNMYLRENDMKIVAFGSAGLLFSTYCLGSFFAEVHDVKVNGKPFVWMYAAGLVVSFILAELKFDFTVYTYPALVTSILPLAVFIFRVLKEKKRPLTTVQKMFVVFSLMLWVHWLDWPIFRPRPDLLLLGFSIAFFIVHVLSVVTPFMGNENILQRRNDRLEEEVVNKALQLTMAEQKLWESNKLASLGRLAGGVAHEINSPLQAIHLHMDNLSFHGTQKTLNDDVIQETINKVKSLVQRIAKITLSLRKVARDSQTLEMQKSDLVQICKDALNLCEERMRNMTIQFKADLPEHAAVVCNPIEVSQIILNLLNNAIDAVENLETRQIYLSLKVVHSTYQLAIEDSGKFDRSLANRFMDPFFTTKAVGKGMGLGLSIAKSIAESHQGQLLIDLNSPKTRFVLELPIERKQSASENRPH